MPATTPLSRRHLFAAGAATAAGAALPGSLQAPAEAASIGSDLPRNQIGIQLYSLRDQVAELGFATVLQRAAEIGFHEIEFAGFTGGGLSLAEIRQALADNGLRGVGNHGAMDDASIQAAATLGLPYTGIGILTNLYGTTSEAWKRTADDLNEFGRRAGESGVKFYVHIHGPEYLRVTDDPTAHALDLLLRYTDPASVFWEMDIYWAYFFASYVGGSGALFDPVDWVRAHKSRFPLFHVKDGRTFAEAQADPVQLSLQWNPFGGAGQLPFQDGITDVGQGNIDFKTFFEAIGGSRDHHYIWERDTANQAPKGEFTSARASYLMMRHDHMAGLSEY
jgi:sugar phosphate isomerase/epimerase